jgi:hypothetical protein
MLSIQKNNNRTLECILSIGWYIYIYQPSMHINNKN